MNWLNPLAFAGLLALGVPILIHLFGRRVARRQRFPSLRLLAEARPTPATRTTPGDVLLLAVRCGVLAAAVLALAQPEWPTADRTRAASQPVRAILVDTSASMARLTSGRSGLEEARTRARAVLDSSRAGIVIETGYPGSNIAGASSWLKQRGGLRELVVISDFQVGAISEGELAALDSGIGTRFDRIGMPASTGAVTIPGVSDVQVGPERIRASWLARPSDSMTVPVILASAAERSGVEAALKAVRSVSSRQADLAPRVALVTPGLETRSQLVADARPLDRRWEGDLLLALRRDAVIAGLARNAAAVSGCGTVGAPIANNDAGQVVASLAGAPVGTAHEVLVFSCTDAGSLASAALLAGIMAATDSVPPLPELEPRALPDELLERWMRPPLPDAPRGTDDTSPDGRWLWLVALALLLVEGWLRQRPAIERASEANESRHARVA